MNKSDLAKRISEQYELNQSFVHSTVNRIFEVMSEHLSKKGRIEIRGFGTFECRYRKPHQAHNPQNLSPVSIDAKYVPHFKPGKLLREQVNASKTATSTEQKGSQ